VVIHYEEALYQVYAPLPLPDAVRRIPHSQSLLRNIVVDASCI